MYIICIKILLGKDYYYHNMPTIRTFQLDVDTKRYVNRVNVFRKLNGVGPLLPTDIADIDNFIVGLKDLNLWADAVCWPLINTQNIGIGTIVASFGGGGIYNGTLVGTLTSTNQGISIPSVNNAWGMSTTLNTRNVWGERFNLFVCFSTNATNEGRRLYDSMVAGNAGPYLIDDFATVGNLRIFVGFRTAGSSFPISTTFNCINIGASDYQSVWYVRKNGVSVIDQNITANLRDGTCINAGIGGVVAGQPTKSQIAAFQLLSGRLFSITENLAVYNLYKSTLGKTLGLP